MALLNSTRCRRHNGLKINDSILIIVLLFTFFFACLSSNVCGSKKDTEPIKRMRTPPYDFSNSSYYHEYLHDCHLDCNISDDQKHNSDHSEKINDCLTKRNTHKTLYITYLRTEPSRHMMIQSNLTTCHCKNNKFRTKSKESRLPLNNRPVFGMRHGLSDLKESFDTEPTRSVRFDNTQMSKSMPTLVNTTKYCSQSCILQ